MPFIDKSPLNYPVNAYDPIRRFRTTRAPTVADYKNFKIGDEWLDDSSNDWWKLCYKDTTQGIWRRMAGTAAAAELFTPDVGGQVGPDALNNINVLGGGGITVTGTPAANLLTIAPSGGGSLLETITPDSGGAVGPDATGTINYLGDSGAYLNGIHFTGDPANNTITAMDLRNITIYVVDGIAGQTEYQTVQAGIDAANLAGGGVVWVRPGLYIEDLVLYNNVDLMAAVASPASGETVIDGTHVPPNAGTVTMRNFQLQDAANILNSAAAGATTIVFIDCLMNITNGTSINLPNWTGLIGVINCHCQGTEDGFIDIGTGSANFICLGSSIGVGSTNTATVSGTTRINSTNIQCHFDTVLQGITNIRDCQINETMLASNDSSVIISDSIFFVGNSEALNATSSLPVVLNHVTIESAASPCIIGTGLVEYGSVLFLLESTSAGTITDLAPEYQRGGPINIIPSDSSVAGEDAWVKFEIPGITGFSNGIDNSDSDNLKLTDGIDPSNGTEYYILDVAASSWEFPINVFDQEIANVGGAVQRNVSNTDDSNAASDAFFKANVGGVSGGDPYITFEVEATTDFSFGIDNNDSDVLCITDGASPSAGTEFWRMTTAGEITMPLQPAFLVYNSVTDANQTGNSALATVDFDSEIYDQNADFAADTFTSPINGKYRLEMRIVMDAITAAMTAGNANIATSNRAYQIGLINCGAIRDANNQMEFHGVVLADMDAADTSTVTVTIANGVGDTAGIIGAAAPVTRFSGNLEC